MVIIKLTLLFRETVFAVPALPSPRALEASGTGEGKSLMAIGTGHRTLDVAHELFEVVTQICLSTLRGRRRLGDLKEVEFLTLAVLQANGTMIVGDIQRILGILPAQMSRVIRSLENRDRPLIQCRINPRDKRKIDVCLTSWGQKCLLEYQGVRVGRIVDRLQSLSEEEQEDLVRAMQKLSGLLEKRQE
jgi:DNA-binding MarR family transcriptional regulator